MGVADHAARVLYKLLHIDMEPTEVVVDGVGDTGALSGHRGQGLMWRRVFGDKSVYELFYIACDLHDLTDTVRSAQDKSLAQARLMTLAVQLGSLDWRYLTRSHIPDVERGHGLDPEYEGLLDFIACYMCNYKDDILMHVNLIQFYANLITSIRRPSDRKGVSVALDYVRQKGLHDRAIAAWLSPDDLTHDPIAIRFVYGPSAQYVSSFLSTYPQAFLSDSPSVRCILTRLWTALSQATWSQERSPKHELHVLTSLPRLVLLPKSFLSHGRHSSPILQIPCRTSNADGLNCLASIFNGPKSGEQDGNTACIDEQDLVAEAAAARAVYLLYLEYNKDLFKHLIDHAETIALPDPALAALNVIASIATAEWAPLPATGNYDTSQVPSALTDLPTEISLRTLLFMNAGVPEQIAHSGILALTQSPAREQVFPYLMRPARKFTNLVGAPGDPENAAYKIAMAKWDLIKLVNQKLHQPKIASSMSQSEHDTLVRALATRISEGPWGIMPGAGGQVASLEL